MRCSLKFLLVLILTAVIVACTGSNDGEPGRVEFSFSMVGDVSGIQDFRAITNDPLVIEAVRAELQLPVQDRNLLIAGPIDRGNGGHNLDWGWHFVPGEWGLVELAMELCDGSPVMVNQAVDYWVDTVGTFCPWDSRVDAEVAGGP